MKYIRNFENYTFSDFYDKNKWVKLSKEDRKNLKYELYDIVNLAYSDIGGHVRIDSPEAIVNDNELDFWNAVDIDEDPNVDVVIFSRRSNGNKISGWGHDGSKESRKEVVNRLKSILRIDGFWIEVSDRPAEILIQSGCSFIKSESEIRELFPNTKIKWIGDGKYTRILEDGKETSIEYVVGKPKFKSFNESKRYDELIDTIKNQLAWVSDNYKTETRLSFGRMENTWYDISNKLIEIGYGVPTHEIPSCVICKIYGNMVERKFINLSDIIDDIDTIGDYVKLNGLKIQYGLDVISRMSIPKNYITDDINLFREIEKPYQIHQLYFKISLF